MPHDKNGNELILGDKVLVEFEVVSVQPFTEFCNVTLRTVERMPGNDSTSSLTLNTKQCNKILPPEEIVEATEEEQTKE